MSNKKNEETSVSHKALTGVGAILCVILIPILVINITLIIKSYTNDVNDVPKIGGYAPLIVLTGSMEPEINSGDLIIVKQIEDKDVQVGDIIAFFDPDGNGTSILTHRVIEVMEEDGILSFRTQGDANNAADRLAVPADQLVGTYRFKISGAGNIAMFMQTTTGFVICVFVPLIVLIAWDMIRRRQYEKKNQQDTEKLLAELEALRASKAAEQKEDIR